MDKRLKIMIDAAIGAGVIVRRHFGKVGLAQADCKKGIRSNLVSKVDHQSQEAIVSSIRRNFPKESILAEEGDLARLKSEQRHGPLWVVDPLDGTVNYLHGFPLFAVSIAFCRDGRPVLGAIYDPVREELFWAQDGVGAYLRAHGRDRRLRVTPTKRLANALMITGFGYDRKKRANFYLSYYRTFLGIVHDVRRTGSACIDLAWIAAGRADGFWEWKLNPWDVAAGTLLVQEAGGRVSHFDGSSYSIFQSEETLATNGLVHNECLRVIGSLATNYEL